MNTPTTGENSTTQSSDTSTTTSNTDSTQGESFDIPQRDYENPTIEVESVVARAGETIEVPIFVYNNPGVAGALLCIRFDDNLILQKAENKTAFSFLDYTEPGKLENLCRFAWDSESGMATQDGVIMKLTFEVSSSAKSGEQLLIVFSYRSGDIYDEELNDVNFDMVQGYVSIIK